MTDPIDKINAHKFCLRDDLKILVLMGKLSAWLTQWAGPPPGAPCRPGPAGALLGLAVGELGGQARPARAACVTVRGARNLWPACKAHGLATRKKRMKEKPLSLHLQFVFRSALLRVTSRLIWIHLHLLLNQMFLVEGFFIYFFYSETRRNRVFKEIFSFV